MAGLFRYGEKATNHLTVCKFVVEERSIVVPELHPDPSSELQFPASLPRILLVLHQRFPARISRQEDVADLQIRGVRNALILGQEPTLRPRFKGVDVRGINANPPDDRRNELNGRMEGLHLMTVYLSCSECFLISLKGPRGGGRW